MPSHRLNPAAATPAAPRLGALPTLALILSVLGAGLSLVTLFIHNRLAESQGLRVSGHSESLNVGGREKSRTTQRRRQ